MSKGEGIPGSIMKMSKTVFVVPRLFLSAGLVCLQFFFASQLMAQAGSSEPLTFSLASIDGLSGAFSSALGNSTSEDMASPMLPQGVVKLSNEEKFLIWVELESGRLNLLEQQDDGGLLVRKVYPISIGSSGYGKQVEGDKKTPVGIYHFTSFLEDSLLAEYYGTGAYPINYPNVLDRRQSRTGSGIWLHGLPKGVEQRPFLDSEGCVIIDNLSLDEMATYINTGMTHIILSAEDIQWQPLTQVQSTRNELENSFESWRLAWESKNNDEYLAFYGQEFTNFERNKNEWDAYKRAVNNSKSSIQVDVSSLSFFVDPAQPELVSVRYYQSYSSNNYNWNGWKEQLWKEKTDGWEIVYEGNG